LKKAVFWVITLAGPVILVALGLELALRWASPEQAPLNRAELSRRLHESERTEVRVVTTGNLRGLIQPSDLPDLVYELKPSRRWVFLGADTATNSHGLRGPEVALEKPPGTLRIAGLGDSVMFGWGVDQEQTYMRLLERRLAGAGRRVEVLNFAVPGYNSAQEAAMLERSLRFSPDLLLVNYCSNDWVAPFFVVDPNLDNLIESSLLLRNIRERLVPGADEGFFDAVQGMDKVRAALRRIRETALRESLPVLIYAYPRPASGAVIAEQLAQQNGFVYVDLVGPFAEHLRERGLSGIEALDVAPGDNHPNAEAHEVIARVLADRVEDLLPSLHP